MTDKMTLIEAVLSGNVSDLKMEFLELIIDKNVTPLQEGSLDSFGVGEYCIVRTYSAGVHCGFVTARNGLEVQLSKARRIWYWDKAFTLSAIALGTLGSGSKLSEAVDSILLTEAVEIIPCNTSAKNTLIDKKAHDPN